MSILSTNKKLISIGAEYSAGQGIDISGHIISVVESAVGANYSAGPNIDIYDVEGQPTISSKDWSSDIADASANAYEQAIAQIPAPQDLSYISAKVDTNTSGINYISSVCLTAHQDWTDTIKGASSYSYEQSTSYFDNWVNGQYTGDVTNITNKISALSGDFSDYYKKTETSSKDEINDALQYVSANAGKVYEGISPIVVNNDENKVSADTWTFSAGSNVSFVDDNVNKITRIDVELPQPQDLSYISAQVDSANAGVDYLSGVVITALPSDLATTGDVNDLAQSISETYQTKGDYAERAFVLSSIESATSGKLDSSSFASVSGDFLTTAFGISESGAWNEATDCVETNSAAWFDNQGDVEVKELVYAQSANWNDVSSKLDSTAFDTWQQGQYTNDIAGLNNLIGTKLDSSSFSNVSGTFYTNDNPSGFITRVDLSNYYTKDETSGKEELSNAFDNIPVGDPEVNAYVTSHSASIDESTDLVQSNSSTWNDVTVYQSNSASYLTAHQDLSDYATTNDLEQVSGDITALIPTDYYPNTNPSGFISGVDLREYYKKTETSSKEEISAAIAAIPLGDEEVNQVVHTNSSTWNTVSDKLDTTSFSDVSGTFLTAVDLTPYYTTADANTLSSMLSGSIDYVSANVGDKYPISADEAVQYVQTNSSTINDVNTSYQTNSGTFLTAHQPISAEEWNSCYDGVNTNSGAWGGTPLPISARDGIDLEIDNNILYIGASALANDVANKLDTTSFSDVSATFLTGVDLSNYYTKSETSGATEIANAIESIPVGDPNVNAYVIGNSANIDDVVSTYQGASGTYLTAHQELTGYVPQSAFDELKQSYDTLSGLFATYSGQWLLPNEGV